MKNAAPWLLLPAALLGIVFPAPALVGRLERTQYSGRQYVRLDTWGRANEFQINWLERQKNLELINSRARMAFTVDSAQAQINSGHVWLSFPVLWRNGAVYISELDLDTTLRPVLFPPANPPGIKIRTICLDPGHGGTDPGFIVGSNQEKRYTLLLAQEVRDQLRSAGLNVVLTRSTDAKVPLEARPEVARSRGADLFVSLHFNSSETQRNEVKGLEVYCLTPAGAYSTNSRGEGDVHWVNANRFNDKNMLLAYQVQKSLLKRLPVEDRGLRRARFEVLREAGMPAVLIEGGFLSHPAEGRRIIDPAYRRQMAQAIVSGIMAYKEIVER